MAKPRRKKSPFAPIEDALQAIRDGKMIIVVDDEDRENEGDLTIAAEKITPEAINFMARYGRGLICMPMTEDRLAELDLPQMVSRNTARLDTAFCVSIEAKGVTSTGISASDRAATVLVAIDQRTRPSDLARPGHMFPLKARTGGVLVRAGQTEAAVDLARIAGLYPAGVICEIMNDDGTMARVPELAKFAKRHKLLMITVADLIQYRLRTEGLVQRVAPRRCRPSTASSACMPTRARSTRNPRRAGEGRDRRWRGRARPRSLPMPDGRRLSLGAVRLRPAAGAAMDRITAEGRGVLLYLNQEGRGIGLANKIRAYELQDQGLDTVEANERLGFKADQRDYGIGVQILKDLGVQPDCGCSRQSSKAGRNRGYQLSVKEWLPLEIQPRKARALSDDQDSTSSATSSHPFERARPFSYHNRLRLKRLGA
jgi:3,4-dihydroxy 2-butanone 4-phosphate synthase/GTP cyclohydrolase II